jgi:hypothetical protein
VPSSELPTPMLPSFLPRLKPHEAPPKPLVSQPNSDSRNYEYGQEPSQITAAKYPTQSGLPPLVAPMTLSNGSSNVFGSDDDISRHVSRLYMARYNNQLSGGLTGHDPSAVASQQAVPTPGNFLGNSSTVNGSDDDVSRHVALLYDARYKTNLRDGLPSPDGTDRHRAATKVMDFFRRRARARDAEYTSKNGHM